MRSIEGWYFKWPWRTPNPVFKVTAFLKLNISKTVRFRDKVTKKMLPLTMKLSDLWPRFQGHDIFWSRISWKGRVWKTKLLLHNRKLYLIYGMVLCFFDLDGPLNASRRLSASAELLVIFAKAVLVQQQFICETGKF